MKENQSPYAVFQIGLGIVCVVIGVSGFVMSMRYTLAFEAMFLGLGILLYGLANNNKDKSERGKLLTFVGSAFYVLGLILIFYNLFFNSN